MISSRHHHYSSVCYYSEQLHPSILPCSVFVVGYRFVCTFESTCQLSGKEHICQLALAVRQSAVVASLAVKVMETDPAEIVCQRGDHYDPGRCAALQLPNQEGRQQEVPCQK